MFRHTPGGLVIRGSTHASPANNKRIQIFSFSKENEFSSVDSDGNCTPTPVLPTREADGVSYIREIKIAFAANMNLYHVTKFSIYLSFTVHYNHTKSGRFTPFPSITIVLSCFYLLISHFENFSI